MRPHHKRHLKRFLKYVTVSLCTFLADMSIVHTGTSLGFPVSIVGPLGFLSMAVVAYLFMHHWVFHDHTSTHTRAGLLYAILVVFQASCIGLGMQYILLHTRVTPEVARLMVGACSGSIGFFVCHFIIFVKVKK